MRDAILLLLTSIAFSVAAWSFWHFAAAYATDILMLVVLLCLTADNIRLRRQLKSKSFR